MSSIMDSGFWTAINNLDKYIVLSPDNPSVCCVKRNNPLI